MHISMELYWDSKDIYSKELIETFVKDTWGRGHRFQATGARKIRDYKDNLARGEVYALIVTNDEELIKKIAVQPRIENFGHVAASENRLQNIIPEVTFYLYVYAV